MSRRVVGALIGVLLTALLAGGAWFVAVSSSSASPDPAPDTVVLSPQGGPPTIYEGPGDRAQLSGLWRFRKDPDDVGLDQGYQTGKFAGQLVRVPYVPDATKISGRKGLYNFKGSIGWYRTHIEVPTDGTYAIHFESVNHRARVYVDGKLVGKHKGEYLPFDVRVQLKAGVRHDLVVRANWVGPTAMKRDGWHRLWFNFGGINRGVSIRRIGPSEISYPEMNTRLQDDGSADVDLQIHLRNNADPRQLGAQGTLTRGDRTIPFTFAPAPFAHDGTEVLKTTVHVDDPDLWSPTAPNLWDLELEVPGESSYRAHVGLREVKAVGTKLMLNGKQIRLRGASFHEDAFGHGDALRPADQDRIVSELKEIGANATRSQHAIDPGLLERLDAAGIMVWQGIGPTDAPGNWTSVGAQREAAARTRARTSMRQGQLHPSIITWNLANEVAGAGHPGGQIPYIEDMAKELHRTDPSRPVALDIWGAHPPKKPEPIYKDIDMIGWTNYIGWYESTNASADELRKEIKQRLASLRSVFPNKVIAVTEFGAEANGRNPTASPGGYAFQAHLIDLHLQTYASIPDLAGALVWNLRDFAVAPSFFGGSIKKLVPDIQLVRGLNQKGLFDIRYKAKPAVAVVDKAFTAEAAAGP
ncbi:MAG TPA: glycoside hydrolase family 2 TIM barrel-domain containing protein [Solirubrobacteraceae bacterium]|nr:glycoside hydrolase family 2 TIM barrel-domain containing protein [Solirubrobacteraceae bacterium]